MRRGRLRGGRRAGAAMSFPPSKTRVVGYTFEGTFDTDAVERALSAAERLGMITQYDVGRGVVWFNGPPGQGLREVRGRIAELVSPQAKEE